MKSLSASKFIMACISCVLLDSWEPLKGFVGYAVTCRSESERRMVEEHARRLGIGLQLRLPVPQSKKPRR